MPAHDIEEKIETTLLDLLSRRKDGATICPSEVPRRQYPDNWRDYMTVTREVALKLHRSGVIEICQKGQPIEPNQPIKGPIRLRVPR